MTDERLEQALTTLALSMGGIRTDLDRSAETLREVVLALTAADDVLAERIAALEEGEPSATQPGPPKRRPIRNLFRRTFEQQYPLFP